MTETELAIQTTIEKQWRDSLYSHFLVNNSLDIDTSRLPNYRIVSIQNRFLSAGAGSLDQTLYSNRMLFRLTMMQDLNHYYNTFTNHDLTSGLSIDNWLKADVNPTTDDLIFGTITAHAAINAYETFQGDNDMCTTIVEACKELGQRTGMAAKRLCLLVTSEVYQELKLQEAVLHNLELAEQQKYKGAIGTLNEMPVYQVIVDWLGSYKALIINQAVVAWVPWIDSRPEGAGLIKVFLRHDAFITPDYGIAMQAITNQKSKIDKLSRQYCQNQFVRGDNEINEYRKRGQDVGYYKFSHRSDFLHRCANPAASWAAVRAGAEFAEPLEKKD